ncbi:MAG: YlmC/YmxH family sporulation protein [Bacilli bacterium]|nr:YlmC/YmxH family sporulation protein [Bacilli bacterium]
MLLSSLQEKDVINLVDGKKIGVIIDASVDKNGKIVELSVQRKRFFFFSSSSSLIKWSQIDKIGKDVILVNVNG